MREAVSELVAIIRQLRPHVVVTYDPMAATATPTTSRPTASPPKPLLHQPATTTRAQPWQVPKFYWTVIATSAMAAGLTELDDVPDGWIRVSIDDVPFGYPDDEIDAVIDATEQLPAKVAALRAHATQ